MERMIERTHIKPNELMFYFEEYLQFKGINKSFDLNRTWKNVKSIFAEIHSGYLDIFGVIGIMGFGYSYIQKCYNNDLDITKIDMAKIKLKIGKNISIGYGTINKLDFNDPSNIVCMLVICIIVIFPGHETINSKTKLIPVVVIIFEIDTSSGYPDHGGYHYPKYSGYHFSDKCKVNSTGHIISEHSYTDYTDLNNNDNENENDFNNVLFELKYNIIEELRNCIKNELKTEIMR